MQASARSDVATRASTTESLQNTLAEIARWSVGDADEDRRLMNIACLIGNQLRCDACSIYLLDSFGWSLVLRATVGLKQSSVGQVQMKLTDGLTGLVAEQRQPVILPEHASAHPRFKYFPEAGEDPYDSFLGVPILERGAVQGVLVVQTTEPHEFDAQQVRMCCLAGRQLGTIAASMRQEEGIADGQTSEPSG